MSLFLPLNIFWFNFWFLYYHFRVSYFHFFVLKKALQRAEERSQQRVARLEGDGDGGDDGDGDGDFGIFLLRCVALSRIHSQPHTIKIPIRYTTIIFTPPPPRLPTTPSTTPLPKRTSAACVEGTSAPPP